MSDPVIAEVNKVEHRILVVDDEAHIRELLELTLIKMGLEVDTAESVEVARQFLKKQRYSLVLTDMRLPDGSGLELVQEINESYRETPVAVITAFGSADNAVGALKAGAFDYVSKPVALDQLRKLVRSAVQMTNVVTLQSTPKEPNQPQATSRMLGQSPGILHVRSQIARLARSMAPVIISGESGSGKELAAREIHQGSARAGKAFVAVNCGAIPENLMEAEFFGYRKGAFTGANEDRDGFFQAANGGTLMLDEVADLPLAMQVKLLRAIQERRVRKLGTTTEEPVDVRIVSATHQNLAECVEAGRFRQDLYYRLNVIELNLPPLRERWQDIPELAQAILQRMSTPGYCLRLSDAALAALNDYEFPGNIRELENILERAAAFANDGCIEPDDLVLRGKRRVQMAAPQADTALEQSSEVEDAVEPDAAQERTVFPFEMLAKQDAVDAGQAERFRDAVTFGVPSFPFSLPDFLEDIERELIRRALVSTRYKRTQAAELLGVSFRQLRYQIQKLKIHDDE